MSVQPSEHERSQACNTFWRKVKNDYKASTDKGRNFGGLLGVISRAKRQKTVESRRGSERKLNESQGSFNDDLVSYSKRKSDRDNSKANDVTKAS